MKIILDAFLDLKFDKKLLFNKFRNVVDKHRFQDKHGMGDTLEYSCMANRGLVCLLSLNFRGG